MDAGRKAAPLSKELAPHVSIIHSGNDGSSIAIPRFPMVIAPVIIIIVLKIHFHFLHHWILNNSELETGHLRPSYTHGLSVPRKKYYRQRQ